MRTCRKCGVNQPVENFYAYGKGRGHPREYIRWACKRCLNEVSKQTYRKNPEKALAWGKEYDKKNPAKVRARRLRKYGLSVQNYQELLARQGGLCAICKEKETCKTHTVLCVDHCHKTKKIRGLLCRRCNTLLGRAKDSPTICRRAAAYLEKTADLGTV